MLEGSSKESREVLLALADALRTPLLRLNVGSQSSFSSLDIRTITDHALRDIDALLAAYRNTDQLQLETLSLGGLIGDVVQKVQPYAALSGIQLEIDDRSRHQPVIANSKSLAMGLELLIKALCDIGQDARDARLIVRADTRHGYPRLGAYRKGIVLDAHDLALARKLIGGARVNAGVFQQLGALRILLATRLLEPMHMKLRSAKSDGTRGLAMRILPSSQVGLFDL